MRRRARGRVRFVRFADDYLLLCQNRADAEDVLRALAERLGRFGLSLHEDKTRLVEFGRFAAASRARRGQGRPETFDFLGFTFCCGTSRRGGFLVRMKTQRKRMTRKLKDLRQQMKRRRHLPVAEQSRWLGSVLRGHDAYFGIPGNSADLKLFHYQVVLWWRWVLRRRGQRPHLPWDRYIQILRRHPLPPPRLVYSWSAWAA